MSLPQEKISYSYTVEEYLALERELEERHEYLDGEIYLMAGESPQHGRICTNINGQFYNQLRGTGCEAFSKDTKIRSGPGKQFGRARRGLFSFPDVLVVCGELRFHDEHQDVLLNPTVIVEVLSPATEAFDRGEKWARYQTWLPELTDYLLIAQAKPRIDWYHRQPGSNWGYTLIDGIDAELSLTGINCTLRLTDVYDRVEFPPEDELAEDELESDKQEEA